MVFRYKSDVNGLRIGLPFFEPEKMAFANAKTFQVRVSVFADVVWKGGDPKWRQHLGIESGGTLEVADCENNVVNHIFLSNRVRHPRGIPGQTTLLLSYADAADFDHQQLRAVMLHCRLGP